MSRSWRDRLLVSLEPDAVALARVAGALRPRLIARQALACEPGSAAEPWRGAVDALDAALGQYRGERASATVVLSSHFVRYAIVPYERAVAGPQEELALARFHFTKVHGERARGWDIRVSEERAGAPRLASAVDAGLVAALRACFPRRGRLRLASVQPYLMAAFNLWRGSLTQDAWLLLVERQRACCALLNGGRWSAVQAARGEFAGAGDWAALLEREQLRSAATAATVFVHAPAEGRAAPPSAPGWEFRSLAPPALEGYRALEDARYAMALTGK